MNYLAHIFLSGGNHRTQIGNFIGDFVKGSRFNDYPSGIRRGILLHRKIDEYTDSHPVVLKVKVFLRPAFGRYSGIITDMYFDYFLAARFNHYTSRSLNVFAFQFYFFALLNYRHLPVKVQRFVFHFVGTNRLKKYGSLDGLKDSLEIMSNYKIPAIDPEKTIAFLVQHHHELETDFALFFPDLIKFCHKENSLMQIK
ncbi:MAG: ACP phosphodiesterase [Paludibacter sp.]|nr:ACP phosphodiesterase [Paludibacter sp.]